MEPREAFVVLILNRRKPVGVGADGNTTEYETVCEYKMVSAKVWPVCMGDGKLLIELEDGRLDTAELWRIKVKREDA